MKRIPLLLAALAPLAVVAGGGDKSASAQVEPEKLRDAVPVTEVVGQDVRARDGETFGEVESIAFKEDGSVAYYEIQPGMDNAMADLDEGLGPDPAADAQRASAGTEDEDTVRVKPENITLEQGGKVVSVDMDSNTLMSEQQATGQQDTSEKVFESDEIVGMEVDLADEESFGEVEDVMLSSDGKEAVALVVDNWDGANKERRALPVELKSVSEDSESIRYEINRDELGEGNFDLDQNSDEM